MAIDFNPQNWLAELGADLQASRPELAALWRVYAAEAQYGHQYVLPHLRPGMVVLEVGAGAMILSSLLRASGFEVYSLEPVGVGFGHFHQLQAFVLDWANRRAQAPRLIHCGVEELSEREKFDFAFSINVMEHVLDVEQGLIRVVDALKPDGNYLFNCPNYSFPYEPHFNIPLLPSKRLTRMLYQRRIATWPHAEDPAGLWQSLNWISASKVRRICRRHASMKLTFEKEFFGKVLKRSLTDQTFAERRSGLIMLLVRLFMALSFDKVLGWLPMACHPSMSCRVQKRLGPQGRH